MYVRKDGNSSSSVAKNRERENKKGVSVYLRTSTGWDVAKKSQCLSVNCSGR